MERLKKYLATLIPQGLCVAFSGGVDSSVVLKLACEEGRKLNKNVYAVTFDTKLHPKADLGVSQRIAKEVGAVHYSISVNELDNPYVLQNPVDRCYHCKRHLFQQLKAFCAERQITHIVDGTNVDDLGQYRPGIKALGELGILSPLAQCSITKEQVREMARVLGLSVSNRPSSPCLATRLPYGTAIDFSVLEQIEKGEQALKQLGFAVNRIRLHGDIARIEVEPSLFPQALAQSDAIITTLKLLGFVYITLDLEGFRSGSMDIHIENRGPYGY